MRILLVSTQDYIHHPIPSRHHHIFERLADRHEIHVPHFHVSTARARQTKLKVHEATKFPLRDPAAHYLLNSPFHIRTFERIIRENRIEVVVGSNILAGAAVITAARKCGVPILFDLKDWFPISAAAYYKNGALKHLIEEFVLMVTKHNLDNASLITTVSPGLVRKLHSLGYAAQLLPNGVDTEIFMPMNGHDIRLAKVALGFELTDFVIGFAGSVEPWYNLTDVLRAFAKLLQRHDNLRLLIVGSSLFTDYKEQLLSLAKSLKIDRKTRFTGAVPYELLPFYLNVMDVCLIPLADREWARIALPDKFFEYSACGKPIVSTPIPDIIDMGRENVFTYSGHSDFLDTIKGLIDDPRKFKPCSDSYSWKRRAGNMEELLTRLVN